MNLVKGFGNNFYRDLFGKHPELERMLNLVIDENEKWRERYGVAHRGANCRCDNDYLDIDAVRRVEICALKELLRVCNNNNITPFLIYGSLLGAVRGDGFVDDDDDIDVALFRDDYDKLRLISNEFNDDFFLQTPENDDAFYGGYCKLRFINSTEISPDNWWTSACEGIGIDIFPMDCGFSDLRKERIKLFKIKQLQRLLFAKCYGYSRQFRDMKLLIWKSYKYIGKLFDKEKLVKSLDKVLSSCDMSQEQKFGIYTHYSGSGKPRYFDKHAFDSVVEMKFEDIYISAPGGWDSVLADLYGDGYLDNVIKEYPIRYHGFYNPCVKYDNYKKRFAGLFNPMPSTGRKITLFGDAEIFNLYDKVYSSKGITSFQKVLVNEIDEFVGSDEDTYPVICAFDVRRVENALRDKGFRDYYFFWYDRNWIKLSPEGIRVMYNYLMMEV